MCGLLFGVLFGGGGGRVWHLQFEGLGFDGLELEGLEQSLAVTWSKGNVVSQQQGIVNRIMLCDKLREPDYGWSSHTLTLPMPCGEAKPPKPLPFRVAN